MKEFTINLLIIDDNQETINKIKNYIGQFNIEITSFFETNLDTVNGLIINNTIDYLFISNRLVNKQRLTGITTLLKSTNNNDCIIVFHDIAENSSNDFKNGNFLLSDELSFDLFKKLIGYSVVNKNLSSRNNAKAVEIYKDDFITTHDALTMLPNRTFLLKK